MKLSGPQTSIGVAVTEGASAVIRGCLLAGADGPAVQIHVNATRIFIERTAVSGCGHGGPRMERRRPNEHGGWEKYDSWYRPGERGAVEIFADSKHDITEVGGDEVGVKVELRSCHVEGNVSTSVRLIRSRKSWI